MTDNRKDTDQANPKINQQQQQQDQLGSRRETQPEDPLKQGMPAAGGKTLRGVGMEASAQQSGRGMGESSAERNWDEKRHAGDDRGDISTGLDTSGDVEGRRARESQQTAYGLGAEHTGTMQGQGSGVKSQGLGSGSTGLDTSQQQQGTARQEAIDQQRASQQNQAGSRSDREQLAGNRSNPQKRQDDMLHSGQKQAGQGSRDDNR